MEGESEARPEQTTAVHDENDALDNAAALLQSVSLEYLRRKRSSSSPSAALPTGGATATGDETSPCDVNDDRVHPRFAP